MFSLEAMAQELEGAHLIEDVVKNKERNQILHACLDRLNVDYREALYLTYFNGMSYAEAAEIMGKSVKQVTNLVYRGKQNLRTLLQKEGITSANE